MSVVEAQPMSVKADGWWSGWGTMSVLIWTKVLVDNLHEIFSWSESPCGQAGTGLAMLQPVALPHFVWI